MKKTALITLLLSTVVFSSAFAADGAFGINGGLAKITGDMGHGLSMGFQAGVFGEFALNEQSAMGIGVDYVRVGMGDLPAGADFSFSIIPITVYSKWIRTTDGSASPYLMVGGGLYIVSADFSDVIDFAVGASENKPGVFIGGGVDFMVNPTVKAGAFAKFHDVLTEDKATMYFHGGVSASFGMASR